jgi:hypothetical protein
VEFDRRGWVKSLANYGAMVWGLEIAARVRVHSIVEPGDIWGQTRVWCSKARCGVCIPLPIHDGCSLLQHPKSRS